MKKNRKAGYLFLSLYLMLIMNFPVYASEVKKEDSKNETVSENRLMITDKREFIEFAENCRLDKFSEDLIVSLEADIDLTGNQFDGIPIFCGMFEGNHHTISGLNIVEDGSAKGLFRYVTEEAVVQNLSVKGKVIPQGSRSYIGGLAGNNAGTILNCSFSGEVEGKDYVGGLTGVNEVSGTIENCNTEGKVQGTHFVGGIAGKNYGVIRDCSNLANVNTEVHKNNLEVSDITMETLTGSEASYTVTDVGGIAGNSSGVIKGCHNQGIIGYQHIGYNIGGIAGSQVGYIYDCENQGQVLGRKEVGGIAGQMEPVANLEFSADTLQILEGQLGAAAGRIKQSSDRMIAQADSSAADLSGRIDKLQADMNNSEEAVTQLLKDVEGSIKDNTEKYKERYLKQEDNENKEAEDKETEEKEKNDLNLLGFGLEEEWYQRLKEWEDISLPDADNILAARSSLNKSMSSLEDTLNSITASGQETANAMTKEMQGIVSQAKSITNTVANASDNIGIHLTDVSDTDTEDNLIGKIENCRNRGAVQADLNVGGILGVVALENDLDPEGELEITGDISLNLEGELRAVILNCENDARVTVRNQNCGGIVGWLSMGLVKDCMNTGFLNAANADYIGGIVGRSTGYIRNNHVKCEILGKTYVGGIAGSGVVVTDCRSMVKLNDVSEKAGNILGALEENYRKEETPISNNFYLYIKDDFGGIDGISYAELAQSLERNQFLDLENLPEEFWKVKVSFIQENHSVEQVVINQGGSLALKDIPEVDLKEGYMGSWADLEKTDIGEILFDLSFEAAYKPIKGTISSKTKGKNDKPVLLLQGNFYETQEVALIEAEQPPETANAQNIIDVFGFTLKEKEYATEARYLIPEERKGEQLSVFVRNSEVEWHETECSVDGSYLIFSLKNGENRIAIVENKSAPVSIWAAAAAAVAVVFGAAVILERKHK
mgnify:CR=1 FL=1